MIDGQGRGQRWLREIALQHESDTCLLWPFAVAKKTGYPVTWIPGGGARSASVGAHVLVCTVKHGPCPPGHQVAHKCGVRRCVAPLHVRWALPVSNAADRVKHGTHREGEAIKHKVRLTKEQARFVKRSELPGVVLADKFGVTPAAICSIRNGRNWKSA